MTTEERKAYQKEYRKKNRERLSIYAHSLYCKNVGYEAERRNRNKTPEEKEERKLLSLERKRAYRNKYQKEYRKENGRVQYKSPKIETEKSKKQLAEEQLEALIQKVASAPIREIEFIYREINIITHKLKAS